MKGVLMSANGVPMLKPKGEELKNAIDVLNKRLNKVEVQARKKTENVRERQGHLSKRVQRHDSRQS
jgi:hypothetical protein